MRFQPAFSSARLAVAVVATAVIAMPALAQQKAAAKLVAVEGALLMAGKAGGFEALAAKSDVPADRLLVAMFGAEVTSPDGAVQAKLVADVGQRGPFASFETRVRFLPAKDADLALRLERGIVVLSTKKKSGATVSLTVDGEPFEIKLHDAKSRVGIEVHGRHMPGPPKLGVPDEDLPVVTMLLFALEGEAVVTTKLHVRRLQAPPGPSLYLWDSISRVSEVQRFEKLPDFAKPFDDKERKLFQTMCGYARPLADKPGEANKLLKTAVASKEALERKTAVVAMGALDDLSGLLAALADANADVRETAVLVARTWLGRQGGQSQRWQEMLAKSGYNANQARNMLYLLNGIETEKLREPVTFDILIFALNHPKAPMRTLAYWHLLRLVPGSDKIAYDPTAPEAQRLQTIAQWRQLVPEGELPRPPMKKNP